MLATMAACENRCYFAGADRVDIGPASALVTTNYGETLPPLRQPRHPATKAWAVSRNARCQLEITSKNKFYLN